MEGSLTITDVVGANESELILGLAGPLTLTTMFDFRDRMRAEKTAKIVIVDMTEVPYVDSAGVGALVNAHVSCGNAGRRFALVGVVDRVRTLLTVTRVDTILAIYPTLQKAEQTLAATEISKP